MLGAAGPTDYEALRAARVAANKKMLADLNFSAERENLAPKSAERDAGEQKAAKPRKKREREASGEPRDEEEEPQERRKSSRVAGIAAPRINPEDKLPDEEDSEEEGGSSAPGKRRRSGGGIFTVGGRVYGHADGTSCHQCRQKTLDPKVSCTNILEHGGLCGIMLCFRDLAGRYGEDFEAALETGDWICPVCRGICNCSICRRKKGKRATGPLKPMADKLGLNGAIEVLQKLHGEKLEAKLSRGLGPRKRAPAGEGPAEGAQDCGESESEGANESEEESEEENVFVVGKILDKRTNGKRKQVEYLVRWEGYDDPDEDTWEPLENLENAMEMVQEFERQMEDQGGKRKKRKSE